MSRRHWLRDERRRDLHHDRGISHPLSLYPCQPLAIGGGTPSWRRPEGHGSAGRRSVRVRSTDVPRALSDSEPVTRRRPPRALPRARRPPSRCRTYPTASGWRPGVARPPARRGRRRHCCSPGSSPRRRSADPMPRRVRRGRCFVTGEVSPFRSGRRTESCSWRYAGKLADPAVLLHSLGRDTSRASAATRLCILLEGVSRSSIDAKEPAQGVWSVSLAVSGSPRSSRVWSVCACVDGATPSSSRSRVRRVS